MPPIHERLLPPKGYKPVAPVVPVSPIASPGMTTATMPTPPTQANEPYSSLRSPLPGIISDPDQVRQVYGRGIIVRRFWPLST